MIVGLLTVRRRGRPAMAATDRMTIEQVVRKVKRRARALGRLCLLGELLELGEIGDGEIPEVELLRRPSVRLRG
jgi:hypothetical protein